MGTIPTEEEFAAWRDEPVTRFVMAACRKTAHQVFDAWAQGAWQQVHADPVELVRDNTRADAYLALEQTDYDGWVAAYESEEPLLSVPTQSHTQVMAEALNRSTALPDFLIDMLWIFVPVGFFTLGAVIF